MYDNELKANSISIGGFNSNLYHKINDELIMNCSIKEQKDHYEIKIEAHGVEDIQISYEKLTGLIFKGSKETLNGRKDIKNIFRINEEIYDLEKLSASIHKGILTICIGKKEEYKEKVLCTLKNEECSFIRPKKV